MSKVNTNMIIITGNLTRDAELKYTANQKPVLTFAVAVNRLGQDNAQTTDYFNVVFWGKTGETLAKWLTKGRSVLVRGSMRSRSYEAKDGHKVTAWELIADSYGGIELLGGGQQGGGTQRPPQQPQHRRNDWNPMDVEQPPQMAQQYAQEPGNIPF